MAKMALDIATYDDPAEPAVPETDAFVVSQKYTMTGGHAMYGMGATTAQTEAAAAAAFGDKVDEMYIYYLAKQVKLATSKVEGNNTMNVDGKYGIIVDVAGVAGTKGFDATKHAALVGNLTAAEGQTTKVVLQNLTSAALDGNAGEKTLKLVSGTLTNATSLAVDYGTIFYGTGSGPLGATLNMDTEDASKAVSLTTAGTVDTSNGTISFAPNTTALELAQDTILGEAVTSAVKNVQFGQNALVDAIVFGLDDEYVAAYNEGVALGLKDQALTDYAASKIDAALEAGSEASVMGVLGGALNVALDANAEVTKALDRRTSLISGIARPAQVQGYGVNAWVDVIGTTNEAKTLYGSGLGYEADLYGAVLGADWTAPCGAIVGAAVSVGTGDANSKGQEGHKIDNDVDFRGFSVYGSHQVGNFNGKFDIGYVSTSNDLSTTVLGRSIKESLDADVFTLGVGAEYLAKVGTVNVVPHVGIRFSKIDMDDSKFGTSYDAMNLRQMPVGVTFSGSFEEAGWKFAPMLDLSVVPAFGDKDAVVTVASNSEAFRVVDTNPIQATLGLSAEQGAWTFGVHYGLTAGGSDRMNNAFNATAKYAF